MHSFSEPGTQPTPLGPGPLLLVGWHHLRSACLAQAAGPQQLWAHLLVCVQMSTLAWGCRMTSKEAVASV